MSSKKPLMNGHTECEAKPTLPMAHFRMTFLNLH